jgi:hypothetical protein
MMPSLYLWSQYQLLQPREERLSEGLSLHKPHREVCTHTKQHNVNKHQRKSRLVFGLNISSRGQEKGDDLKLFDYTRPVERRPSILDNTIISKHRIRLTEFLISRSAPEAKRREIILRSLATKALDSGVHSF